jgi:hypothetical protein
LGRIGGVGWVITWYGVMSYRRKIKENKMDLIFGTLAVFGGLAALFLYVEARDFNMVKEKIGWKILGIMAFVSFFGLWYFLTQPAQWMVETYQITDTFKNENGSVIVFNRPVLIKKKETGYDWCAIRGRSVEYTVDNEGGCK